MEKKRRKNKFGEWNWLKMKYCMRRMNHHARKYCGYLLMISGDGDKAAIDRLYEKLAMKMDDQEGME